MIEFLRSNSFDSFNDKRYWLYGINKQTVMFTVQNGIVWHGTTVVESIEGIKLILNE